jgi:3-phosphoshikimate 1-carboxyvinyltransferase
MSKHTTILIQKKDVIDPVSIKLSPSKSESNRVLIIDAFTGKRSTLENLSDARDTQIMRNLLGSDQTELNVLDAGTTMRFLTAFFSIRNEFKILMGTPRMNERPVKVLVDALREIGAEIYYINADGYPPIELRQFKGQKKEHIVVRGDISSQYISALLMVSPILPKGLTLELIEPVNSRPYIEMTLVLMEQFGIRIERRGENIFHIGHQQYKPIHFKVESDWSGASYWYSFIALCRKGSLHLEGLKKDSLQGDRAIAEIMSRLGVKSTFNEKGVLLEKSAHENEISLDFAGCPDLAQTVAVACAAKGISCRMTGLESLRIKETDRIFALQNELAKIGARLDEESPGVWSLIPGNLDKLPGSPITIKTYEDHRMAMAFAPLATMTDLIIKDPNVVQKSYPGFWDDMRKAGFSVGDW